MTLLTLDVQANKKIFLFHCFEGIQKNFNTKQNTESLLGMGNFDFHALHILILHLQLEFIQERIFKSQTKETHYNDSD